jgi:hypothetical protein
LEREKKLFKKFSAFCQPAKNIYIFQTIFRLKKLSLNWKEAQTFRKQSRGAGNKKEQLFFKKKKFFFPVCNLLSERGISTEIVFVQF